MTDLFYPEAKAVLARGASAAGTAWPGWANATLKVALVMENSNCDSLVNANVLSDFTLDELTSAATRQTLATKTLTEDASGNRVKIGAAVTTFPNLAAGVRKYKGALIYWHIGADSVNVPLIYRESDYPGLKLYGGNFTLGWEGLELAYIGEPEAVSYFDNPEFRIEANQAGAVGGRNWTRVTATDYGPDGGWAFVYRFGNSIRARFMSATLVNGVPTPLHAGDLQVDTINLSTNDFSDEPDISWHPGSGKVVIGWNHRTGVASATLFSFGATATWNNLTKDISHASFTAAVVDGTIRTTTPGGSGLSATTAYRVASKPNSTTCRLATTDGSSNASNVGGDAMGDDMDQRFRTYSVAGAADQSTELRATHQVSVSQWRPLFSAIEGPSGESWWMCNFTNGPFDHGKFNVFDAASPFAFAIAADVDTTDTGSGRRGENDGCQLDDGSLFGVWNNVEGQNTRVRWKRFGWNGSTYASLGASTPLPASIGMNKLDPRCKADDAAVWIAYHAQQGTTSHSNEYDGVQVWATVLDGQTLATVRGEFQVTAGLTGIGRRPEVAVYGGGKCLIVWEHYPDGYVDTSLPDPQYGSPSNPKPIYAGVGYIYLSAYDETGSLIAGPITVNSATSAGQPCPMRPDISINQAETAAMICWTAAATVPDNGGIYTPATSWRLWAREFDITALEDAA